MSRHTWQLILGLWLVLIIGQQLGVQNMAFDRQAIDQGHYWLLVTAHFVHLNTIHLLLNMLAIALVLAMFDGVCPTRYWISLLVISAAMIGALIYYRLPKVDMYVGLSGVIHTVYVFGALLLLAEPKERIFASILLSLVTLKLLTESYGQGISLTADLIGGHVLVQAHLYGAIVGLFWGVVARIANYLTRKLL